MDIIIADSQARIRHALRVLFEQQPGWTVTGEAADAQALLAMMCKSSPNLILVDWDLPGLPQVDLIRTLQERFPGAMHVVMSGRQEFMQPAMDAGADGFACKTEPPEKLLSTIQKLMITQL